MRSGPRGPLRSSFSRIASKSRSMRGFTCRGRRGSRNAMPYNERAMLVSIGYGNAPVAISYSTTPSE